MIGNIKLDDWQEKIVNLGLTGNKNIAIRAGRQVGKSTAIAVLAGEFAVKNEDKVIMIISAVERQAFLLFEKVLEFIDDRYSQMVTWGKNKPTKSQLTLKNGSRIYCLPTGLDGYGIRGYTIDLLIADEAAYINDDVFNAITPSLAARKNAKIVLLSTPFGREGYFARAFNDPTFETFHITSEECSRINKEFLEQEKKRMTKRQYMQEYLGEFIDELLQWFPDQLIKECMKRKRPEKINKNENYFLGVDLARMGKDETTFEIGFLAENKRIIQVENLITRRTRLNESAKMILELDKIYNFRKIYIDDEGIGVGVYDFLLENEQVRRKLTAINNSKRVLDLEGTSRVKILKEDLYNNLLRLMETGQIELLDDPEIFQSLKSVQYDYTTDSLGRSHLKIFGNYTHIAEGLIRLGWCIKEKGLNIWVKSI